MKSLFTDNRIANIMQLFRRNSVITVSALASKLNVSERTIRNDIKQLNQDLKDCAVIEGGQGEYGLHIFDADIFHQIYVTLLESDDFLNSTQNRMDYIFGKLMRAEQPLLTDELAYEMNVGRTTLVSDLKKLRTEIQPYSLTILGKTSKGLFLRGQESDIRQYVLDCCYDTIYREYPLDKEIRDLITQAFAQGTFEKSVQDAFIHFTTLMLDRFLTGHGLSELSPQYYNLSSYPSFSMVDELTDKIGAILHVSFPPEEKLFAFLPIAGMRTPTDIRGIQAIRLDENIRGLMQLVLRQIKLEMNITIGSGEFTEEFLYHLMLMMNRLRFGIHLVNPMLDELKEKYPLAYQMAGIASKVIQKEYHIEVTEDERGYLASYFGVFLTENDLKQKKPFRVAVVCGTGRVTARLVATQLKKVLDSSAELTLYADEAITEEILNEYDIILTTVHLSCSSSRPIIRIHEIFNERELLHKIEKAKYWNQIDVPMLDNNWFVMNGLLEESRFFVLDDAQSYDDAVRKMVENLTDSGQVDSGFLERLRARERKGTMVFDHSIAIPHGIQYAGDKMILSIGVCSKPIHYNEYDIRVIFLIGLPEQIEADDNLLIRVYDEIMNIAQDDELMDKVASAESFHALLRVLYRQVGK